MHISAATKSKLVVMFTSPALKCTWLLILTIPAKICSTGNFGTSHDFLSRPSSRFRISRFLPLRGWQVRKLDTAWCLHKMIPCIGVSALRALVIRVTIKQIMGKQDHQGDRKNGKCRFVPDVPKSFFTCRLPFITSTKKITVSLQHCASFYLLISCFEKLSYWTWRLR